MMEDYVAVNKDTNPVSQELAHLDEHQIAYIVSQYSLLPREITALLYNAKSVVHSCGWEKVAYELKRNLGEELGTETDGVPHFDILCQGFLDSFDIDLRSVSAQKSTADFLFKMKQMASSSFPELVVGSVYALESCAIPEISMVLEFVREWSRKKNGSADLSSTLEEFFEMHLNVWEVGHEDELRKASAPYITSSEAFNKFEDGFRGTLKAMDLWWEGMFSEASAPDFKSR